MRTRVLRVVVDILMFVLLILVVISPYFIRTLGRGWYFLGMNLSTWHQVLGYVFTGFLLLHIILNFKWLVAVAKNFLKVKRMTKAAFIVMLFLFSSMCVSIISGAYWGINSGATPPLAAANAGVRTGEYFFIYGGEAIILGRLVPQEVHKKYYVMGRTIQRANATQTVRIIHILSSWAAVLFAGFHVGLHFSKFLAFLLTHPKNVNVK